MKRATLDRLRGVRGLAILVGRSAVGTDPGEHMCSAAAVGRVHQVRWLGTLHSIPFSLGFHVIKSACRLEHPYAVRALAQLYRTDKADALCLRTAIAEAWGKFSLAPVLYLTRRYSLDRAWIAISVLTFCLQGRTADVMCVMCLFGLDRADIPMAQCIRNACEGGYSALVHYLITRFSVRSEELGKHDLVDLCATVFRCGHLDTMRVLVRFWGADVFGEGWAPHLIKVEHVPLLQYYAGLRSTTIDAIIAQDMPSKNTWYYSLRQNQSSSMMRFLVKSSRLVPHVKPHYEHLLDQLIGNKGHTSVIRYLLYCRAFRRESDEYDSDGHFVNLFGMGQWRKVLLLVERFGPKLKQRGSAAVAWLRARGYTGPIAHRPPAD